MSWFNQNRLTVNYISFNKTKMLASLLRSDGDAMAEMCLDQPACGDRQRYVQCQSVERVS